MAKRYRLDPDELSPADLKRAKAGPLEGRDPYAVLHGADATERLTLVMWCLLSRDNPDLSWAEAEATPFKAFDSPLADDAGGDVPPPTASNVTGGGRGEQSVNASGNGTKNPSARRRVSAAST